MMNPFPLTYYRCIPVEADLDLLPKNYGWIKPNEKYLWHKLIFDDPVINWQTKTQCCDSQIQDCAPSLMLSTQNYDALGSSHTENGQTVHLGELGHQVARYNSLSFYLL
jgi:hypothetical protein